jgi:hypothetical protein
MTLGDTGFETRVETESPPRAFIVIGLLRRPRSGRAFAKQGALF